MIFLITFSETRFFRKTGFLWQVRSNCFELGDLFFLLVGKVRLGCFWLCDRTTSKKCVRVACSLAYRFFQLSLEKAIILFSLGGKKCDRVVFGYAIALLAKNAFA
ncbi:hypothetical protein [Floridanema aerugineum]|uniref:Uncharacterized protein n=1 Tax=Floridaenema aerugineum BLCC-F46 TaxID=3153654 RepID=A0ABV4WZK0_9CYAN